MAWSDFGVEQLARLKSPIVNSDWSDGNRVCKGCRDRDAVAKVTRVVRALGDQVEQRDPEKHRFHF